LRQAGFSWHALELTGRPLALDAGSTDGGRLSRLPGAGRRCRNAPRRPDTPSDAAAGRRRSGPAQRPAARSAAPGRCPAGRPRPVVGAALGAAAPAGRTAPARLARAGRPHRGRVAARGTSAAALVARFWTPCASRP
jgi:hypothetical protein